VLDLDASIVVCHSEKETAAATWKGSSGYHTLFCFLDATGAEICEITGLAGDASYPTRIRR
jgi:hypothetical protein